MFSLLKSRTRFWPNSQISVDLGRSCDKTVMFVGICFIETTLQWRHNDRDDVSNHRCLHCLLNCLFRCRPQKASKLRVRGIHREFPAQKASNAENVSIKWRHHDRSCDAYSISFPVASLALGQPCDCPDDRGVTLMDMGKLNPDSIKKGHMVRTVCASYRMNNFCTYKISVA